MPLDPHVADRIATDMTRIFKKLKAIRQQTMRLHPQVDPASYPILFCLLGEPNRISGIADTVHSDVSTVSRQINSLETADLVSRTADPSDRRACLVELTEAGRRLTAELRGANRDLFVDLLADWDAADARVFAGHLSRLDRSIDAAFDRTRTTSPKEDSQ